MKPQFFLSALAARQPGWKIRLRRCRKGNRLPVISFFFLFIFQTFNSGSLSSRHIILQGKRSGPSHLLVCMSVWLPVCLPIYLSVCLSLSVCLYICLSVSICLSIYLSVCLYLFVYIYVCLFLSVCLYICLYLFVYISVCLSLSVCLYILSLIHI